MADVRASLIFSAPSGGTYQGVRPPKAFSGTFIRGAHLHQSGGNVTVTASRYYMQPIYLVAGDVFAGAQFYNTGVANNGHKVKVAIYSEGASGGPGALAKNFGEQTLSAAAAIRQIASSWTVPQTGWYYLELVADNAVQLSAATGALTGDGPLPLGSRNPYIATSAQGVHAASSQFFGYYVGGTYANFPEATPLAPTDMIYGAVTLTNAFPDFGLYA